MGRQGLVTSLSSPHHDVAAHSVTSLPILHQPPPPFLPSPALPSITTTLHHQYTFTVSISYNSVLRLVFTACSKDPNRCKPPYSFFLPHHKVYAHCRHQLITSSPQSAPSFRLSLQNMLNYRTTTDLAHCWRDIKSLLLIKARPSTQILIDKSSENVETFQTALEANGRSPTWLSSYIFLP